MGDNVISDGELVFSITSPDDDSNTTYSAGTTAGQVILEDVTFTMERDNTMYHGIGNDEPQGMSYGNKTYSLSTETIVNEDIAQLVVEMYNNGRSATDGVLRSDGALEVNIGKIDWNSVEKSASDDGDVTLSIDADCRDVTLNEDN